MGPPPKSYEGADLYLWMRGLGQSLHFAQDFSGKHGMATHIGMEPGPVAIRSQGVGHLRAEVDEINLVVPGLLRLIGSQAGLNLLDIVLTKRNDQENAGLGSRPAQGRARDCVTLA
jgi:hypothetical protein